VVDDFALQGSTPIWMVQTKPGLEGGKAHLAVRRQPAGHSGPAAHPRVLESHRSFLAGWHPDCDAKNGSGRAAARMTSGAWAGRTEAPGAEIRLAMEVGWPRARAKAARCIRRCHSRHGAPAVAREAKASGRTSPSRRLFGEQHWLRQMARQRRSPCNQGDLPPDSRVVGGRTPSTKHPGPARRGRLAGPAAMALRWSQRNLPVAGQFRG